MLFTIKYLLSSVTVLLASFTERWPGLSVTFWDNLAQPSAENKFLHFIIGYC